MWDTLMIYAQQDPRWFEPLSRYVPDGRLLAVYRELAPDSWRLTRRGIWFLSNPPDGGAEPQGWKLHVASHPDRAAEVLRAALPVCFDAGVPLKFLLDTDCLAATSGKRWPRSSSGKFITVYPGDEAAFRAVAKALTAAVDGTEGAPPAPFILTDRRVPGALSVYYRYGGFAAVSRLSPDGTAMLMIRGSDGTLVPDVREPYYSAPDWVTDPFGEPDPDTAVPALGDGRFVVTEAVAHTNAGGVYLATDQNTGGQVILKEARPGVLVGQLGLDATEALEREYHILRALSDVDHVVTPIAFFREWEHVFLAEEYVSGAQMSQRQIAANPILTADLSAPSLRAYYSQQRRWWLALAATIRTAHRRGILLGDLSFTNVLVRDADDQVVLVDLEAGVRIGTDAPLGLHTPGVASPRASRTGTVTPASDYHCLGALLLGSVMLVNAAVGYHPEQLDGFVEALTGDLALPADLGALITELMDPDAPPDGPDPDRVYERIEALDFDGHPGWSTPVPLALPAPPARVTADRLGTGLTDLVDRGIAELLDSADVSRTDRLFPGHVLTFEANPYSVAYGAAGVLHAVRHIRGSVPPAHTAWLLAGDYLTDCPPGLYTGLAGIAWVLDELDCPGAAGRALGAAVHHELVATEPGILLGAAGVGLACLRRWHRHGQADALRWAVWLGERLAATAERDERGASWPVRDPRGARVEPIGYARGASGVALFLLYLHLATGDADWLELGRAGLDYDLSHAVAVAGHDGRTMFHAFPPVAPAPGEAATVVKDYWDEGTAGVATALLRYLAVAPDEGLVERWARLRPDLCRSYGIMPQLFHGLASAGMALLDAAELVGDSAALDEAWRTAEGVTRFAIPTDAGVAFPGEQCLRQSADLATGTAGVLLFLHRVGRAGAGTRTNTNFVLDELIDPAGPGGPAAGGR